MSAAKRPLGVLLLAVLLLSGAYAGYRWQRVHAPDYALEEILHAVRTSDGGLFDTYVDRDAVLAGMHEDAAVLLADNIEELHARHLADWFFCHDAAFMRSYMAARRAADISYAGAVLDFYFHEERVPLTRADGAARWGADEVRAFAAAYRIEAQPLQQQGDTAVCTCILRGDASTYGRLLPEASLTLTLTRQTDGRWRLTRIGTDTVRAHGFFDIIDGAERYWALQGWD